MLYLSETLFYTIRIMKEIKLTEVSENLVKLISKDWMLVTAGTADSYNMMTASWGFMGHIWGHDMAEIVVRQERYTKEFIDRTGRFTLSFFPHEMTKALQYMGSHSGRTSDKMAYEPLRPEVLPTGQITFCGARLVIECDVVYHDPLDPSKFVNTDLYKEWYGEGKGGLHERYYGKIVRVWVAE